MDDSEITEVAKRFIGNKALGTAVFAIAVVAAYSWVVYLGLSGQWSLWLAFPIASYLVFMAYTPLHESVHGNICGRHRQLRLLNDATGYLVASIMGFSFNVHKWAHRVHHRTTNIPGEDPDHVFIGNTLYDTLLGGFLLVGNEYRMYFRDAFGRVGLRRQMIVLAEISGFIVWRLLLTIWFPWEMVLLFCLAANIVGVTWLVIIFAWLVHIPFDATERYRDTSTYLLPKSIRKLGTWIWLFQNYHSVHHLFPRIPFYHYDKVFDQLEPVLEARGTPIHRW